MTKADSEIQERSNWTREKEVGKVTERSSNPPTDLQHPSNPLVLQMIKYSVV